LLEAIKDPVFGLTGFPFFSIEERLHQDELELYAEADVEWFERWRS
jgi:hypothetical protein